MKSKISKEDEMNKQLEKIKSLMGDPLFLPQLRMMIREIEEIIGKEITADEWNCF